jgi:hypothetical protein
MTFPEKNAHLLSKTMLGNTLFTSPLLLVPPNPKWDKPLIDSVSRITVECRFWLDEG